MNEVRRELPFEIHGEGVTCLDYHVFCKGLTVDEDPRLIGHSCSVCRYRVFKFSACHSLHRA